MCGDSVAGTTLQHSQAQQNPMKLPIKMIAYLVWLIMFLPFGTSGKGASSSSSSSSLSVAASSDRLQSQMVHIIDLEHLRHTCMVQYSALRYAAIQWNYTANLNENITLDDYFLPSYTDNEFNCDFNASNRCNHNWSIKNWQTTTYSNYTSAYINDYRWNALKSFTTQNSTYQIIVPQSRFYEIALSVKGVDAQIRLCTTSNASMGVCYLFEFAKPKHINLYRIISSNSSSILNYYSAFTDILSYSKWSHFVVRSTADGELSILDKSMNRELISVKQEPLMLHYGWVHSANVTVWKVHTDTYIYTTLQQISRLGPPILLRSPDLCVSMLLSMCSNCSINFFINVNGARNSIGNFDTFEDKEWRNIKLKAEKIQETRFTIFMDTKCATHNCSNDSYWAIRHVRMCHENEIRFSNLLLNNQTVLGNSISCQALDAPAVTSKGVVTSNKSVEGAISVETIEEPESLHLSWDAGHSTKDDVQYFITYYAVDSCTSEPFNLRRQRSSGFIVTGKSELVLKDLVPFTLYNVSVSSTQNLTATNLHVHTLESALPTYDEMPRNIQVQVSDSAAYVSWAKVDCRHVFGSLVYEMQLHANNSLVRNVSAQLENSVQFDSLDPFTAYSLTILTRRNDSHKYVPMTVDFTTKSGVARAPHDVEVYSSNMTSVLLRFAMEPSFNGEPSEVQVIRCMKPSAKKCKTTVYPIGRCQLWAQFYCVHIDNLAPNISHTLKVSVKNAGTDSFGPDAVVNAVTEEKVPGVPTIMGYKIFGLNDIDNFCKVNVTWQHPFHPNGTISSYLIKLSDKEAVVPTLNNNHSAFYSYVFDDIPYGSVLNFSVASSNRLFISNWTNLTIQTHNIGTYLDQKPRRTDDQHIIEYTLPLLDHRLQSYRLLTIVQDFNKSWKIPIADDLFHDIHIKKKLCHNFGYTWIASDILMEVNESRTLILENLRPQTQYCVTFMFTNKYDNKNHNVFYYDKFTTGLILLPSESHTYSYYMIITICIAVAFVLAVLVVVIVKCSSRNRYKARIVSGSDATELVYEAVPLEDSSAINYNKLT